MAAWQVALEIAQGGLRSLKGEALLLAGGKRLNGDIRGADARVKARCGLKVAMAGNGVQTELARNGIILCDLVVEWVMVDFIVRVDPQHHERGPFGLVKG